MTKYDQTWVSQHYDEYGEEEWYRWEKTPADNIKFHIHSEILKNYVNPGYYVLDIGAGAGRFTGVLAEKEAKIVVGDISTAQLELNKRYAKKFKFDNAVVSWRNLDVCDMGTLDDGIFDTVVCYGGPLSYVFEKREQALGELIRVLKPGGFLLVSVMSLWGAVHKGLLGIFDIPKTENHEIIKTGDLHPDIYSGCKHRCHMFTAAELRSLLEVSGLIISQMAASNCLTAVWGEKLTPIMEDPDRWEELLWLESQACRTDGCLDLGTHIIAAARKQ